MREIKFRAWDGKEMYTPVINENGNSLDIGHGDEIVGENEHPIMQYTGIKDKHGKEIYEGDIIKFNNTDHCTLSTIKNGRCAPVCYIRGAYYLFNIVLGEFTSSYIEIINNVYEDPELSTC